MTVKLTIFQGDSSDTVQTKVYSAGTQVTDLTSNGYTATFSVVDVLGNTPLFTKTMTEVTNTFRSTLLPADTVSLDPGHYKGVVQVINTGLSYKKEDHLNIRVNKQGYSAA